MSSLDREEFIRRTDRGVFSVEAKRRIDAAQRIRFVSGTVRELVPDGRFVEVLMTRFGKQVKNKYDRVIVAIGFNAFAPLSLLAKGLRPNLPPSEILLGIDEFLRIPTSRDSAMGEFFYSDVHMPMLAGVAQGPGFPNLSCLGTLADRILKRYINIPL
jgi:mycobactin lysine-N-oxygenase